jgi:hypothetical protein
MPPLLLAALIDQVAIPELARWLAGLHAEGRPVTEEEALAKLKLDADEGDAAGRAFLAAHPPSSSNAG